jgi:hypothetical protein
VQRFPLWRCVAASVRLCRWLFAGRLGARRNALLCFPESALEFIWHGSSAEWIFIEHRPTDDVAQIVLGTMAQIAHKAALMGKPNEFAFDYVTSAHIARCNNGSP